MKIKELTSTTLIIILLSLPITKPTIGLCQHELPSTKAILDDLQRGFWLNKNYLTKLLETKSPRKAGKNIIESGFTVKRENNEYLAEFIYKFHETLGVFPIVDLKKTSSKNVYELLLAPTENKKSARLVLKEKGRDEIRWTFTSRENKNYEVIFVRVEPTIMQFVNKTVLAGDYKDKSGHVFKFTVEGMAIWPDKTFKYEVDLNMEYDNDRSYVPVHDEFYYNEMRGRKLQSTTSWPFAIRNNKLLIYEPNVECCKKILFTLEKIK